MARSALTGLHQRAVTAVRRPGELVTTKRGGQWVIGQNASQNEYGFRSSEPFGDVFPEPFWFRGAEFAWTTFMVPATGSFALRFTGARQLPGVNEVVVSANGMPDEQLLIWGGAQYTGAANAAAGWYAALAGFLGQPVRFWLRDADVGTAFVQPVPNP